MILFIRKWQKSHEAGAFDGSGQNALVLLAGAGAAGRQNLCLATQKIPQNFNILVTDSINIFGAKVARFIHIVFANNANG